LLALPKHTVVFIVGGGPAGLAAAIALRTRAAQYVRLPAIPGSHSVFDLTAVVTCMGRGSCNQRDLSSTELGEFKRGPAYCLGADGFHPDLS
jgi:hypothetical protein